MIDTEINWAQIIGRMFKKPAEYFCKYICVIVFCGIIGVFFYAIVFYGIRDRKNNELAEKEIKVIDDERLRMKKEIRAYTLKSQITKKTMEDGRNAKMEVWMEAVDNGYGEWVVVDNKGSTEFRWKKH